MDQQLWEKTAAFHRHECPGLAIGFKACEAAKEKLGVQFAANGDEELVCVTENDACGVDAVQYIAGCSVGKGNLIYRGSGKMAFSFFDRKSGKSLRMILKPIQGEMSRDERKNYILHAPVDALFDFKQPHFQLPEQARIFSTLFCEKCGEGAPEHKIRFQEGKKVCSDCFEEYKRGW